MAAIAIGSAALWIPLAVFLAQPERQLLGERGHLGIAISAAIQVVSLIVGFAVAAAGFWDDDRARRWSVIWGWAALPAGIVVAWVVPVSVVVLGADDGRYLGRDFTFIALVAVVALPAVISPRRQRVLAIVTTTITFAVIAAAAVVVSGTLSLIVIGPSTAYCVLITLKSVTADYTSSAGLRHARNSTQEITT